MTIQESKYSKKSTVREMIFGAYFTGEIDRESVISRLGVSRRQFYRLQAKLIKTDSLSHGLCNKPSNRSIPAELKNQVINLYKIKYTGFNYEHMSDLLCEREQIIVTPSTLRSWLIKAKLSRPKRRKLKKYERREPKAQFGQMLQLDGTFDDFLGNGSMQCLMHLVDDATKTSLPILADAECTSSALKLLHLWCTKYGVPQSIYCDKHSTYKVNERQRLTIEEELEGKELRLTKFAEVCERLGIELIFAHSPQAKGRVERKHHLYKDRWLKELKLDDVKTMDEANNYLLKEGGFIDKLNSKFTIKPRDVNSACVSLTPAELTQQFTINNTRTVRNDYTVQLDRIVYQLQSNHLIKPKAKVLIKQYLDGSIGISDGKANLKYTIVPNYVRPIKPICKAKSIKFVSSKVKQSMSHPYRQYKPERKTKHINSSGLTYLADVYS